MSQKEYLPSPVNALTKSRMGSNITNIQVLQVTFTQSKKKIDKSTLMEISQVFGTL